MLPMTDETFHMMGPKDLGIDPDKKSIMNMDIARTTNHTGEQLHISVPMYADDDRATVSKRLGFAFSIIQDRMESENKAMEFIKERSTTVHRGGELVARNEKHFQEELNKISKQHERTKLTSEEFVAARTKLMEDLKAANEPIQKDIEHARAEMKAAKELPKT
jgi:hypothetical protein